MGSLASAASITPANLVPFAFILLFTGVWLIKSGFRKRFTSNSSRCIRCEGELNDPRNNRCPRCGIEPVCIQTHKTTRSNLLIVGGILCLLPVLFFLTFLPFWVSLLIAGLFVLNYSFLWLMKWIEGDATLPPFLPSAQEFASAEVFDQFLKQHGTRALSLDAPSEHLPLHRSFVEFFNAYENVTLAEWVCYERRLLASAYESNSSFVQFGTCIDGSPILARRQSEDPIVYINDVDECLPEQVIPYAISLQAYFFASQEDLGLSENSH